MEIEYCTGDYFHTISKLYLKSSLCFWKFVGPSSVGLIALTRYFTKPKHYACLVYEPVWY